MRPVDTHCHLDFDQYDDDREEVVAECAERLEAVVNVGTDPDRNRASLDLARAHDHVHATVGLHPTRVLDVDRETVEEVAAQVRDHADDIVAVGEIGLDYHHVRDPDGRARQADIFRELLAVAEDVGLPVALHTRDAERDAFDVVQEYSPPVVVQHCFNGEPSLALEAVDAGQYVSVSTQVLYSNRVQDIAEVVPLDRILLETDAPFLYRGERNVPWHVAESAETIAEIKEVAVDEVVERTTRNAREALDLPV